MKKNLFGMVLIVSLASLLLWQFAKNSGKPQGSIELPSETQTVSFLAFGDMPYVTAYQPFLFEPLALER